MVEDGTIETADPVTKRCAEESLGHGLIEKPIAIVAMQCNLPGAPDLEQFWKLLQKGKSAVGPLPDSLVERDLYLDRSGKRRGTTSTDVGAIVDRKPIDMRLLGLAAEEADQWDECHLRFATVAKAAFNSANCTSANHTWQPERCGVYVGHSGGASEANELIYAQLAPATASFLDDCPQFQKLPAAIQTSLQTALIANMQADRPQRLANGRPHLDANAIARLTAKVLDISGPQVVVEAACASSLVALGLAAMALEANQIDTAIVGGASYNKQGSLVLFSQAHSSSSTDSRPFDDDADGLISSEGFVVLIVKRLADAVAAGDKIEAVINGIGIASDGRGKSLWAPRREGQIAAMQRAYENVEQIDRLQYVEAHATSTKVGDATETAALAEFFTPFLGERRLPVGSVKSNIGHTLETAGLAGLVKATLSMQHRKIVPSINFRKPNSRIDWLKVPFDVVTMTQDWPTPKPGLPRTAAVNAFGIGGLNVHVVIEEYLPEFHRTLRSPNSSNSISSSRNSTEPSAVPIAIIGLGCVLPGANDSVELARLLSTNESFLQTPNFERWPAALTREFALDDTRVKTAFAAGFLDNFKFDWRGQRIPPKQVQNANPLQFMLLQAAGEALAMAGLNKATNAVAGEIASSNRTGVVVGTAFGGEFGHGLLVGLRLQTARTELAAAALKLGMNPHEIRELQDQFETSLLKHRPALLDETGSFTSSTLASRITKHFNLMGGAFAIDGGSQSSGNAINFACQWLRSGAVEQVICATGSRSIDGYCGSLLHAGGRLPGQVNNADGLWPAEGVVSLMLERLDTAQARDAKILGTIESVEFSELRDKINFGVPTVTNANLQKLQSRIGKIEAAELMVGIVADLVISRPKNRSELLQTFSDQKHTTRLKYHVGLPVQTTQRKPADIASTPIDLKSKLMPAATRSPSPHRPLQCVGCLPGQGSQSQEMLNRPWLKTNAATEIIAQANQILSLLGQPTFADLLQRLDATVEQNVWPIQATMLISGVAYANAAIAAGNTFDALVGHSLGELAALVVADAWSLESAIRFVQVRSAVVVKASSQAQSGLTSVSADRDTIEKVLRQFNSHALHTLAITHINSPSQSVVGGTIADLQLFETVCKTQRISFLRLTVPAAFHHPLLYSARFDLLTAANHATVQPPRIPVLSTVTNRFVADPEDIRQNLVDQLITPIDYVATLQRLSTLGVCSLIELGCGSVLTKFHRNWQATQDGSESIEIIALDQTEPRHVEISADSNRKVPTPFAARSAMVTSSRSIIDATSSRRNNMRNQSQHKLAIAPVAPIAATLSTSSKTLTVSTPFNSQLADTHSVEPTQLVTTNSDQIDRRILTQFIIDFIVEHTGYPLEMIEPSWDLEADLGVDSIKQVQLFGELRQTFDLDTSRFREVTVHSINDICDVILEFYEQPQPSIQQSVAPEQVVPTYALETSLPISLSSNEITADVLESFIIDFVVEHTGYPLDMIDLEAELESDLGIDSIKLAQLVGEIRSSFDYELTIEDRQDFIACRTLRDIGQVFLNKSIALSDLHAPSAQIPTIANRVASNNQTHSQVNGATNVLDRQRTEPKLASYEQASSIDRTQQLTRISRRELESKFKATLTKPPKNIAAHQENVSTARPQTNVKKKVTRLGRREASITRRYVLRTIPKPPEEAIGTPQFFGRAVIIGNNAIADQLEQQLGTDCVRLNCEQAECWPDLLTQHWNDGPLPHLFITSPHDPAAIDAIAPEAWTDRRRLGVDAVFWLCQRWLMLVQQSGLIYNSSLVLTPNLGGSFGFADRPAAVEGGALSGLLKAMIIECWMAGQRRLAFKIIDLGAGLAPSKASANLINELAYGSYDTEIAYTNEGRHVARAIDAPIQTCNAADQDALPQPGQRWICTGGARGITAFVSEHLAKRYGLKLHLVGVTELMDVPPQWSDYDETGLRRLKMDIMQQARKDPKKFGDVNPLKAWQTVEKTLEIRQSIDRMRKAGIEVHYHSTDCSNKLAVDDLIASISSEHGPIHGVLYGAGIGQDSRFERKLPNKVDECFSAKLDGPIAIWNALKEQPLTHFIGFGSISGRFGANGHTDYSAANEGLAKVVNAFSYDRPEVRSIAFHWHAWGDIGMATKPETKLALESIGMQFMPATEGLQHLIDELESEVSEAEVLITDDRYHRAFYPAETIAKEQGVAPKSTSIALLDMSTLHAQVIGDAFEQNLEASVNPTTDPFLIEHRLNDRPLLPAVVMLEAVAEAGLQHQQALLVRQPKHKPDDSHSVYPITFKDFRIVAPLKFFSDHPMRLRTKTSTCTEEPNIAITLSAEVLNRSGMVIDADRLLCQSTWVQTTQAVTLGKSIDEFLKTIASQSHWHQPTVPTLKDKFYSGPPFQMIHRFAICENRLVAELTAPSLVELAGIYRDSTRWLVPSAVLDAALYSAGILSFATLRPGVCLPTGFQSLSVLGLPRPGQRLRIQTSLLQQEEESIRFDFDVIAGDNTVLISARGYQATFI